jgi:hypothetical protein
MEIMGLGQHPPHLRPEAEGVRQYLEDDVAMAGAEAVLAKRSQTERMRGVVGKVEPAFH